MLTKGRIALGLGLFLLLLLSACTNEDEMAQLRADNARLESELETLTAEVATLRKDLEPIYAAVRDRFGELAPELARGISCRHDWGPQYTSSHFTGSLAWLGIEDSPSYVGAPCNGCAERFIRTLKEQCIWSRTWRDVDELAEAVRAFVELYNTQWLIERHGHRTPREAYLASTEAAAP